MWKLGVLLVLATCRLSWANPSCDLSSVLPCMMPAIAYMLGPEGQELATLKDGGEINEQQLLGICRLGQSTLGCMKDHIDRCVPRSIPDIHDFMAGTANVMTVCDKPGMYSNAKVLMKCNQKLNATSTKFRRCTEDLSSGIQGMTGGSQATATFSTDPNKALDMWKSGNMLRDLCCKVQNYKNCMGTEVTDKCGADAAAVDTSVFHAMFNTYSCQGRVADCSSVA
ncbi:uncharacterized protein LOC129592667 [Paramacrobiotus metropolitanus]|uniref:uncharacterized protein LOC129592667 n=1 Tax=Paramacrobiotus metropolitanus TaxID=2943436 RepID=UPI002445DB84|nr:uncharacterized protein LOC129592667 [Paramacrobiotus metropolitanus]